MARINRLWLLGYKGKQIGHSYHLKLLKIDSSVDKSYNQGDFVVWQTY